MRKLSLIMNTVIAFAASVFLLASCTPTNTGSNSLHIGKKSPTAAKAVGDIVFNDGSATPYSANLTLTNTQKKAAIAVIFYVGNELNSDVNGESDITTSRTLGIGLNYNSSRLSWCRYKSESDIVYGNSTNITTIQCPASGNAGALTFTGDKNGSDNLEQIAAFLGSNDDTATAANYPAFYFAKNYSTTATNLGTTYNSGWYLPSIAELFAIWKVKDTVDAASSLCGGSQFDTSRYWSSSQYASGDYSAYVLGFRYGSWDYGAKYYDNDYGYVCAVREFN